MEEIEILETRAIDAAIKANWAVAIELNIKILAIDNKKADPMKMFVGQAKMKEKTDAIKEISGYYQKKI